MLIIISVVYNMERRDKRVLKCKWNLVVINLNCYNFEIFYVSPLVTTEKIPIQITEKKKKSIKKNPKTRTMKQRKTARKGQNNYKKKKTLNKITIVTLYQ